MTRGKNKKFRAPPAFNGIKDLKGFNGGATFLFSPSPRNSISFNFHC